MGRGWTVSRSVPVCGAIRAFALAPVETRGAHSCTACLLDSIDAHGRYLLACRARVASGVSCELAAFHDHCRDRRPLDGLLLPQSEIASAAARQRATDAETSRAVA